MAEQSDFDAIFIALHAAAVRYLVVGGVGVVLHGVPRFTADLDLVIALDDANVRAAIRALTGLGYKPERLFRRSSSRMLRFADRGSKTNSSSYFRF